MTNFECNVRLICHVGQKPDFKETIWNKVITNQSLLSTDIRTYSNSQLLQSIIGSESDNLLEIVKHSLNNLEKLIIYDLRKNKGIDLAKAFRILALIELGKRGQAEFAQKIIIVRKSSEIFQYFYPILYDLHREEFWLMYLHMNNKDIGISKIGLVVQVVLMQNPKLSSDQQLKIVQVE